jgi:hypothetical protein
MNSLAVRASVQTISEFSADQELAAGIMRVDVKALMGGGVWPVQKNHQVTVR